MYRVYDQLIDDEDDGARPPEDVQALTEYVETRTSTKRLWSRSEPRPSKAETIGAPMCPEHGEYPRVDSYGDFDYDCGWSNSMGYHCS